MKRLSLAVALIATMVFSQPSAQEGTGDPLVNFEQVLERQPDDLKAGNDYRVAVMQAGQYDRGLAFFQRLVAANPSASNAHLNYGFAYVDKIPVAGAITQVILANNALTEFTSALELRGSWIGYYTRGNSYLYWPRIFLKTHLGVADLEEALKIQRADKRRSYHVRTFVALGDGYWKMDELDKATATWRDGLDQFPDSAALRVRLSQQGRDLKATIDSSYDPNKRVDTSLQDLWASR
jgi:tetratricopeptide (TPR) repeat protein